MRQCPSGSDDSADGGDSDGGGVDGGGNVSSICGFAAFFAVNRDPGRLVVTAIIRAKHPAFTPTLVGSSRRSRVP